MRFLWRSLFALFLLSVTVGFLTFAASSIFTAVQTRLAVKDAPRIARERIYAAKVVQVVDARVTPVLTAYGEIRSRRTLELRAPRAGTIKELAPRFEDGAQVTAGQVLVRLDPADQIAARDLALNDHAKTQAEVLDATRSLDLARDELAAAEAQASLRAQALARQTSLLARGVGSEAAIETAAFAASAAEQAVLSRRQSVAQAEARVDQARTATARMAITLAQADRALRETILRAEFSGILAEVNAVVGGVVGTNERLAQIIDPDALEAAFRLSTAQYVHLLNEDGTLRPAPTEIALDVMGTEIATTGRLDRASAAVGAGQSGRLVYAALNASRGFLPGDFVTVRVSEPELTGVSVLPAAAVGTGQTVLVLGDDDRLESAVVEVLRRQGDDVIVRAPHLLGREVVNERTPLLGVGIRIRPIRPDAGDPAAGSTGPQAGVALAADPQEDLITLSPERRAALIAFVESSARMQPEARARLVAQLSQEQVPSQVVSRLESRMGG